MFDTLSLIIEQENNNWFVSQDNESLFQNNLRHYGINQHIWNYERKEDKKNREYFPHVEIRHFSYIPYWKKLSYTYNLLVRFSAPKLLYGNNLYEVQASQFKAVCEALETKLNKMGISITSAVIKKALITRIDVGHNIVCNGIPVDWIIKRLASAGLPKFEDNVQKTSYRMADGKAGQQITFYSEHEELTFYDKYRELVRKKEDLNLVGMLTKRKDLHDILRMEIRLKDKESIQRVFGKKYPTFAEVFKENWAKKLITQRWNCLYQSLARVVPDNYPPEYLLLVAKRQKHFSFKSAKDIVFIQTFISSIGEKATKELLKSVCTKQEYDSMWNRWKKYRAPVLPAQYDYMKLIDIELKQFEWLTPEVLQKRKKFQLSQAPMEYGILMTPKESQKYLKVTSRQVQRLCEKGQLGHIRIGKKYLLRMGDILGRICLPKI